MGVEAGVGYIDDLVVTNPESTDVVAEGDDHIRLTKAAVKGSFTSLGREAVTKTAAEINDLVEQTNPVLNVSVSGTAVLDEDDMVSDSDTRLATQQSIKAYVDAKRVIVTPPEIFTAASTINAWQTINIATLADTLSATIRFRINTSAGNSVSIRTLELYVRQTGSGLGLTAATQVISKQEVRSSAANFSIRGAAEFTTELNSNGDFDLYIGTNDTSVTTSDGAIIAYYI